MPEESAEQVGLLFERLDRKRPQGLAAQELEHLLQRVGLVVRLHGLAGDIYHAE